MLSPFAILTTASLGGVALLSVWPGMVESWLSVLVLAVPGIAWLTWAAVRTGSRGLQGAPWPWRGTVLIVGALAAIWFNVPRWLAFAASRSSFENALGPSRPEAPMKPDGNVTYSEVPLPSKLLGIYSIMECRRDARGGVYFRTGTSDDVIDEMSWGFVWRPNRVGSPYGRAKYRLRPLGGDWYSFRASNDF